VLRSSSDSAWTCASIRPGTIHLPSAETTFAPAGSAARAFGVASPTDAMRPSATTRSAFSRGGAPVPSIRVAPRKTIVVASRSVPLTRGDALLRVERVFLLALLFLDLDGIDPREARRAGRLLRAAERREHPLDREVAQAVRLDEPLDLLDRLVGRDQLAARRRVDAVVAGVHRRRRGDAHVHLAGPGVAQHPDDLARGRAADDRVVDQDDPLALHDLADRIQLDLDSEVPDGLLGLDERAADVVIADEAQRERDAGLLRVAERGVHARSGHGNHDVRLGRVLPGQPAPEPLPRGGDAPAEDHRVRPGEVDVLEDAGSRDRKREAVRRDALARQPHDLARLDVAVI